MADAPAAPIVPVQFNEGAIAEDLTHHPPVTRKALDLFRREVDRDGGLSFSRLKGCEDEGRDGTRLDGCVKTYVHGPQDVSVSFCFRLPTRRDHLPCEPSHTVFATLRLASRAFTKSPINDTTPKRDEIDPSSPMVVLTARERAAEAGAAAPPFRPSALAFPLRRSAFRGPPQESQPVETAGIEPASAVASGWLLRA